MKAHVANKILSGFSGVLSLTLLITCTWILISLYKTESEEIEKCSLIYHVTRCDDVSHSFDDEDDTVEIASADDVWKQRPKRRHKIREIRKVKSSGSVWTGFEKMTSKFRKIIIPCLIIVIIGSLIQMLCSLILIFSSPEKIPTRSRRIVYVLFIVFLTFLMALIWPAGYKRQYGSEGEEDHFHTMSTLNSAMMEFMSTFTWPKLMTDLYLYYVLLFSNSLFIFLYMVISCFLLLRSYNQEDFDVGI